MPTPNCDAIIDLYKQLVDSCERDLAKIFEHPQSKIASELKREIGDSAVDRSKIKDTISRLSE